MRAKVSSTSRQRGSLMPLLSLPSEKVPAPPSPNCTLLVGSKTPPAQNFSTSAVRASTSRPRSSTSGRSPAWASRSAANSPAGPMPATTGRCFPGRTWRTGSAASGGGMSCALWGRCAGARVSSTSSVREKWTSRLSRASTDFRNSRTERISCADSFSARAARRSSGASASFRLCRSWDMRIVMVVLLRSSSCPCSASESPGPRDARRPRPIAG